MQRKTTLETLVSKSFADVSRGGVEGHILQGE